MEELSLGQMETASAYVQKDLMVQIAKPQQLFAHKDQTTWRVKMEVPTQAD